MRGKTSHRVGALGGEGLSSGSAMPCRKSRRGGGGCQWAICGRRWSGRVCGGGVGFRQFFGSGRCAQRANDSTGSLQGERRCRAGGAAAQGSCRAGNGAGCSWASSALRGAHTPSPSPPTCAWAPPPAWQPPPLGPPKGSFLPPPGLSGDGRALRRARVVGRAPRRRCTTRRAACRWRWRGRGTAGRRGTTAAGWLPTRARTRATCSAGVGGGGWGGVRGESGVSSKAVASELCSAIPVGRHRGAPSICLPARRSATHRAERQGCGKH